MASSNTVLRYILSAEYSDIDRLPTSPHESCSEHEDPYEARSITSEKKCARPTLLNLSGFHLERRDPIFIDCQSTRTTHATTVTVVLMRIQLTKTPLLSERLGLFSDSLFPLFGSLY